MPAQDCQNYERIAAAITLIRRHFREQPSLAEIAAGVHMSPAHFQRVFTEWAGTSPKKFLQYISLEHARHILSTDTKATLFDAAFETGLSSSSRLHDLFVNLEGMTPGEYKNGGRQLTIRYSFSPTHFGQVLVASTPKGICHLAFVESDSEALAQLTQRFPQATYLPEADSLQAEALSLFQSDWSNLPKVKLHLKGSPFQLKVWESLLHIPMGRLNTYGGLAKAIKNPAASRAVGTAIGSNPIAFLIPCHRVIRGTGETGGYMWGSTRKQAIIGWEQAQVNKAAP